MVEAKQMAFDFEEDTSNIAFSTVDGPLRVWETETARLVTEFLPEAHLTATCNCLRWKPCKSVGPKQKSKRKSRTHESGDGVQGDESKIVAVGSATGAVNLYNINRGEIQCQLESSHKASVADVCWSHDGTSLYSAHSDGLIVHWDTLSAKQKRKWKCGKSDISCLTVCGDSHLIIAGRSIALWDLNTLTQVQSCTGHSTDILQVHAIFTDPDNLDINCLYIISVAQDDRVVSLWTPNSKSSKSKRAQASFILDNEPVASSVYYDRSTNCLRVAVLTTASSVELFEYQLNGIVSKKPIKPVHSVHINKPSGKHLPILACKLTGAESLLMMYGTEVSPAFETLQNLGQFEEYDIGLERQDPSRAQPVTKVTSVGNVRQPKLDGDVTTLTPAVEGGKRLGSKKSRTPGSQSEKRPLEEPEATIEEKLALMRDDRLADTAAPTESLATLLSQGLQSDDTTILNKTLRHSDPKTINTTIRRLPLTYVMPLMKHLTARLERSGSSGGHGGVTAHTAVIKWVRALLHIHASYLATFPELMERLQRMYTIMENRVAQLNSFTKLQGRLELVLSQIARQKDDEQGAEASAPLLTLQDESSEDEMMEDLDMAMVHSESEDGYLSADEDDLTK